nr:hypothetical protein CDS [Bradyrhizobium sp.]
MLVLLARLLVRVLTLLAALIALLVLLSRGLLLVGILLVCHVNILSLRG